jgi:hypothetical protein
VKRDIHEAITERFIEQLKRGTLRTLQPGWRRGFDPNAMEARHQADRPNSLAHIGNPYRYEMPER